MKSADIITAFAAIAAWVALWINVRVTQDSKETIAQASWDDARTYRTVFWPIVRSAFAWFRISRDPTLPEDLDSLIESAGMPPNVPLKKNLNLRDWLDSQGTCLNSDQRHLWEFASAIYPPRTGGTADVMEESIIPLEERERFHRARQVLATFFQRGRQRLSNRSMEKISGHADDDVILLSWLEIALVRATRDDGPGKGKMFDFGNYLQSQQR